MTFNKTKIIRVTLLSLLIITIIIAVVLYSSFNVRFFLLKALQGEENAYNTLIKINHNDIMALKGRAFFYSFRGLLNRELSDRALTDYNHILTLHPDDIDALKGRIGIYWARYHRDKFSIENNLYMEHLIEDCSKLIDLGEVDYNTLYIRSAANYDLGNYPQAITDLAKCISIEPDNPDPYALRAEVYFLNDEYHKAVKDMMKAHKLKPETYKNSPEAWLSRWIGFQLIKSDYEELDKSYTRMIENNPDIVGFYVNRAWNYIELEQYDDAIADYTKAIELEPDNAAALARRGGVGYRFKGDYQKALEDCNNAIKMNPGSSIAYYFRSLVYDDMEDYKMTISDLEKAIQFDPQWDEPYTKLGDLYIKIENYDRALSFYEMALTKHTHIGVIFKIAAAFDAAGRINDAITSYQQYLKYNESPFIFGWNEDNMKYAENRLKELENL